MIERVPKCPHCGQSMKKYWHRMTPGLVTTLIKFAQAIGAKGKNSIHLRKDMEGRPFELTRDEWTNFSKLRFHGLVAHDREKGNGYWLLTSRGGEFLKNQLAIPLKVQTFNNQVESHEGPMVTISDIWKGDLPFFEKREDIEQEPVTVEGVQERLL